MKEIFIELGCEEIPARMLSGAVSELQQKIDNWIKEENIDPDFSAAAGGPDVYGTPRRLVIHGSLPDSQSDTVQQIKGPPEHIAYDENGEPTGALEGFCRQNDVEISDVIVKDMDGGSYLVAQKKVHGRPLEECLQEDLPGILSTISWPKKMRWENSGFKFVRPIRWLVVFVDDKTLDIDLGPLSSGVRSRGLRFGENSTFEIQNIENYFETMQEEGIILSVDERKTMINSRAQKEAETLEARVLFPESILDEVTNLVEAPTVFSASFEDKFLNVPEPVLIETMVSHQKYFPLVDRKSEMLIPEFIAVRNGSEKGLDSVRRGNERVLRARLNDAEFFYNKDLKRDFEDYRSDLRGVVFQEKLGSLYDKTERLAALALELPAPGGLERVGRHCKNDQVTEVVGELPSLQGVMGKIYARESGWNKEDALVIEEHYRPAGRESKLPSSQRGCWLSLIDRLDTLVGFFALGERPSGAKDPYGLRRDALGLLRVILDFGLDVDLKKALNTTIDIYRQQDISVAPADLDELQDFLKDRLYFWFREQEDLPAEEVEAVLDYFWFKPLLARCRLGWLLDWKGDRRFEKVKTAAQRVVNITSDIERSAPNPELFESEEENVLWEMFKQKEGRLNDALQAKDSEKVLEILASFKKPVDYYFEEVMVMCEDENLQTNRLTMLRELRTLFDRVADFSVIQGS